MPPIVVCLARDRAAAVHRGARVRSVSNIGFPSTQRIQNHYNMYVNLVRSFTIIALDHSLFAWPVTGLLLLFIGGARVRFISNTGIWMRYIAPCDIPTYKSYSSRGGCDSEPIYPSNRTLFGPLPRFGDKLLGISVVCPQNGTTVNSKRNNSESARRGDVLHRQNIGKTS